MANQFCQLLIQVVMLFIIVQENLSKRENHILKEILQDLQW